MIWLSRSRKEKSFEFEKHSVDRSSKVITWLKAVVNS